MSSATKYGDQISSAWRWSCESGVNMSRHASERWDERCPSDAVAPETAWEQGVIIDEKAYRLFEDQYGNVPDEVRTFGEIGISRPYQAVMIERNETIRTVLTQGMLRDEPTIAYLAELLPRVLAKQHREWERDAGGEQ